MVSLRRENRKSNLEPPRTASNRLLYPLVSLKDEDSLPGWFFIARTVYYIG